MASSADGRAADGPALASDPPLFLTAGQDGPPPHSGIPTPPSGTADASPSAAPSPAGAPAEVRPPQEEPPFILYKAGPEFGGAIEELAVWVHGLLLPVYGREVTSMAPWCSRWWEHLEAVAQLYGLWMAWQELTGSGSTLLGPASWHRDFLLPVMSSLRDPSGPFAGCKPGRHRDKEAPPIEVP
jgi:hypothetical protein